MKSNDPELIVECDCGGEMFRITKWLKEDVWLIECFFAGFYSKQETPFSIIARRFKAAWNILRGKEFSFFDVVLSTEKVDHIHDFIEEYRNGTPEI